MEASDTNSLEKVMAGGGIAFAGKLVSLGLGFLTQVALARLLSPTQFGSVVLVFTAVSLAVLVGKLGLDEGLLHFLPRAKGRREQSGLIQAALAIAVLSGLGWLVVIGVFARPIACTIGICGQSQLLLLGGLAIPFGILGAVSVGIARGVQTAWVYAVVDQVVKPGVKAGAILGLVLIGYGALGAVGGFVLAYVVSGLLALGLTLWVVPSDILQGRPAFKRVLLYSAPLVLVHGAGILISNADIFMLGYFLTTSAVGVYRVAFLLQDLITAVAASIGLLLPPMLSQLAGNGSKNEMRQVFRLMAKWLTFASTPIFVVLFFAPGDSLAVTFGAQYSGLGSVPLQILVLANFLSVFNGLQNPSLVALGDRNEVIYITGVALATNILLNLVMIPEFGIVGAAVSSLVGYVVGDLASTAVLYRNHGIMPFSARQGLSTAMMVLTGGGIVSMLSPIVSYPVIVAVLAVVLPVVLVMSGGIGPEDEQVVQQLSERTDIPLSTWLERLLLIDLTAKKW